jgi:hypothetical protein
MDMRGYENRMMKRIFGIKREDVAIGRRNCIMMSFITCMLRQIFLE